MTFDQAMSHAMGVATNPSIMGTRVVVRRSDETAEFEANGVFGDQSIDEDVNGQLIPTNVHTIGVRTQDLEWTPKKQDLVINGSVVWVVTAQVPDGSGMTTLYLHRDG